MQVLITVCAFVVLAFVGWSLNELFAILKLVLGNRFREASQLPTSTCSYTSRFAQSRDELERVLLMRSSCFKNRLVPDAAYLKCWENNPRSMKIVFANGEPIGFWGVAPVPRETLNSFIKGHLTHDEILRLCKGWEDTTEPVGLYVFGVVVPLPSGVNATCRSIMGQALQTRVVCDLISFLSEITDRMPVCGVASYPATPEALQLMEQFQGNGLLRTSTLIEGKQSQPVFRNDDLGKFRASLKEHVSRPLEFVPLWQKEDRDFFFNNIGTVTKS